MPKTVEQFVGNILAVRQKEIISICTGKVILRGPALDFSHGPNYMTIKPVTYLLPFQRFMEEQTTTGVATSDLFSWFTQMQLRGADAWLACILVKIVIPALSTNDAKLRVQLADGEKIIDLKEAKACKVRYGIHKMPDKCITYKLRGQQIGERMNSDLSVAKMLMVPYAYYYCLSLADGGIVDLNLAQFTGDMQQQKYYESLAEFKEAFPAGVFMAEVLTGGEVNGQLFSYCQHALNSNGQTKTIKEVSAEMIAACGKGWKDICRNCFNFAEKLRSCGGCKKVRYCGKFCQDLHWEDHRKICANKTAD